MKRSGGLIIVAGISQRTGSDINRAVFTGGFRGCTDLLQLDMRGKHS